MLPLDRMGHEHSRVIISEVIGDKALPRGLEEEIIRKADGIPSFIEELTKSVVQSERVQEVANRYLVHGPLPLAVPVSLLDSLTARLDQLGSAKEIAQIGAVIGREFSQSLLAAVVPKSANSLQTALGQLAASELVFISRKGTNTVYKFKACTAAGCRLRYVVEGQAATTPQPCCARSTEQISAHDRNGTRGAGLSLWAGRTYRARHRLLAKGRTALD